jgi:DNA-binding CsgD family transcriptional regulator
MDLPGKRRSRGGDPISRPTPLRRLDATEAASPSKNYESSPVAAASQGVPLSRREQEVVRLLLRGDRVPAIAQHLWLTQSTIRNHLYSAYRKLGVKSQQELIALFRDGAQPRQRGPTPAAKLRSETTKRGMKMGGIQRRRCRRVDSGNAPTPSGDDAEAAKCLLSHGEQRS